MGAPEGNQNAVGNSGGGSHTVDRFLVAKFKGAVLKAMQEIIDGPDKRARHELIMKMGPHCIPKDMDITSGGKAIVLPFEVITKHAIDTRAKEDSSG